MNHFWSALSCFLRSVRPPNSSDSMLGFHGDQYLLNLVSIPLERSDIFIETGTNRGQTAKYVADRHRQIRVASCEPDSESFDAARERLAGYDGVDLYNQRSQEFLGEILTDAEFEFPTFFLDAHGDGFEWPLKFEIERITAEMSQAAILIDDFLVPGRPEFGYDQYDGQECSMEFIADELHDAEYVLFYPDYCLRTSNHHPLRGYGLLLMNCDAEFIPPPIHENFRVVLDPV